ncbi:unnamed protein product, partial [marine sediment metagenome]
MKEKIKSIIENVGLPRIIIFLFLVLLFILTPVVGIRLDTSINDVIIRVGMNGILVLSLVPMVKSGCGLNFGLQLGIIAGLLGAVTSIEMVTGFMLAFFMNGIYQLVVLYGMGNIIPISNSNLLLPRGYGIRNAINLLEIRQVLDKLIPLEIGGILIPIASLLVIATLCVFIIWFRK